jgi:hypothetical protein
LQHFVDEMSLRSYLMFLHLPLPHPVLMMLPLLLLICAPRSCEAKLPNIELERWGRRDEGEGPGLRCITVNDGHWQAKYVTWL